MKGVFTIFEDSKKRLSLFIGLLIIGLVSSRALLSITTAALGLHILATAIQQRKIIWQKPLLLVFTLPFFVTLFSGINSIDTAHWLTETLQKLPILLIPLAFAQHLPSKKQRLLLFYIFIAALCVSSLWVLLNYGIHFHEIQENLSKGQPMPAPLNHVRYSLLLACGVAVSIYLSSYEQTNRAKTMALGSALFLFIMLHFLAVRTGLLAVYAILLFLSVRFVGKRYGLVGVASTAVVLFGLGYIASASVPSLKQRIAYMKWDLAQFKKGEIGQNTDGRRLRSWQVGWQLWKNAPVLGYGAGDIDETLTDYYEKHYPETQRSNRKYPHNQYLFTALEWGALGVVLLLLSLLLPFLIRGPNLTALYISIWLAFVLSSFFETTWEGQLGMTSWAILVCLSLYDA